MSKRALISVYDKTGIIDFAKKLNSLGYEIISTGGTYNLLKENNLKVIPVEDITDFKEMLDGRVKTLHPKIHGGILAKRNNKLHMKDINDQNIQSIDIVVVNLYPFSSVISNENHAFSDAIENIDIGGPSMLRAAAKNYEDVLVVSNISDYDDVINKLENNLITIDFRLNLATKVFSHTASYDAIISEYLQRKTGDEYPEILTITFSEKQDLRYGENPHQNASYYKKIISTESGIENAILVNGKELSYNNINDTSGAIELTKEFRTIGCVAVKHATPCGAALGKNVLEAYTKTYESDPISIFGGIVAFNAEVDKDTANKLSEIFLEVIIAPSFSEEAFNILSQKKNLRILVLDSLDYRYKSTKKGKEFKIVAGGLLVQDKDCNDIYEEDYKIVTNIAPSLTEIDDLHFAMTISKHVKSNAIVLVKDKATVGIGGGEVSRIDAAEIAAKRAGENAIGSVMGSDAFFPFPDVVELCAKIGVKSIIQPGGSKNDILSVEECDKSDISMIFTGKRHFKH